MGTVKLYALVAQLVQKDVGVTFRECLPITAITMKGVLNGNTDY
jgi:hypothetical protein